MACNKNKARTQVKEYLLRLSAITSEVSFLFIVKARYASFVLLTTTVVSLALGRISFFRCMSRIPILFVLIFFALRPKWPTRTRLSSIRWAISLSSFQALSFKLQMTRKIIKCFNILIVRHVQSYLLPSVRQWTNVNLDLLFITQVISICVEFVNHGWHLPKMLLHIPIKVHLIRVKLGSQPVQSCSRGFAKLEFQRISHFTSSLIVPEHADQITVLAGQHNKARTTIFLGPFCIGLNITLVLWTVALLWGTSMDYVRVSKTSCSSRRYWIIQCQMS